MALTKKTQTDKRVKKSTGHQISLTLEILVCVSLKLSVRANDQLWKKISTRIPFRRRHLPVKIDFFTEENISNLRFHLKTPCRITSHIELRHRHLNSTESKQPLSKIIAEAFLYLIENFKAFNYLSHVFASAVQRKKQKKRNNYTSFLSRLISEFLKNEQLVLNRRVSSYVIDDACLDLGSKTVCYSVPMIQNEPCINS